MNHKAVMKNKVMKLKGKTKAKISRNVLKLYLQVCKGAVKSLQNNRKHE